MSYDNTNIFAKILGSLQSKKNSSAMDHGPHKQKRPHVKWGLS